MEKLKVRKMLDGTTVYIIWCKACQETHSFNVRNDGVDSNDEPNWKFNGDFEKPSFSPSLRYRRCHLILKDGIIHYCKDCRHRYWGKDVPLEEF